MSYFKADSFDKTENLILFSCTEPVLELDLRWIQFNRLHTSYHYYVTKCIQLTVFHFLIKSNDKNNSIYALQFWTGFEMISQNANRKYKRIKCLINALKIIICIDEAVEQSSCLLYAIYNTWFWIHRAHNMVNVVWRPNLYIVYPQCRHFHYKMGVAYVVSAVFVISFRSTGI